MSGSGDSSSPQTYCWEPLGNQSLFEHATTQGNFTRGGEDCGIAMLRPPPSNVRKLLYTTNWRSQSWFATTWKNPKSRGLLVYLLGTNRRRKVKYLRGESRNMGNWPSSNLMGSAHFFAYEPGNKSSLIQPVRKIIRRKFIFQTPSMKLGTHLALIIYKRGEL